MLIKNIIKFILLNFVFNIMCLLSLQCIVNASGFLLYNQNAAATAQATAVTAQIDNASAIFYNPAAINQLKGTQTSFGTTIVMPVSKFKSYQTGKTTHMKNHIYLLPNAYITHELNDKLTIGIGSYSPFGLATDWNDDWEGKFISTFAQIQTISANPVISYQVNPDLSIAAGFCVIYSDVTQRKALNPRPLQIKIGSVNLKAYDVSCAFNCALLCKITDSLKWGVSYRSAIDLEYSGKAYFKTTRIFRRFLPENDVSVDITLPPVLATGLSAELDKHWTVEFDIFWVGWSTFDKLYADFKKGVTPSFKRLNPPIPRNYHDILDYAVGIKYQANDFIILRGGFIYDSSPVPRNTVDPILPDANKYCFSAGVSFFNKNQYSIDLTYYGLLYRTIKTNSNYDGFNGRYESHGNIICLGIEYKL